MVNKSIGQSTAAAVGLVDLLCNANDGVFAIDEQQRIIAWSPKAEAIVGLTEAEVLGRYCYDALDGRDEWGEPVCRPNCHTFVCAMKGEPPAVEDIFVPRPGGGQVRLNLSVIAIPERTDLARAAVLFRENGVRVESLRAFRSARADVYAGPPGSLAPLEIRCFGQFQVHLRGEPIGSGPFTRPKVQTLFKMLVAQRGRTLTKEKLIDLLWPEADIESGSRNLKVLVHTLRSTLGDLSGLIQRQGEGYLFGGGDLCWLDVEQFLGHLEAGAELEARGAVARAVQEYEAAERLYQGDYLAGDLYEDWCAGERERLKELCLSVLTKLASLYAACGQYETAAHYCRKALARDNCRESVYRDLMRYLWWSGHGPEAVRQYRVCQDVLERELGIGPLPETTRLYQHIVQDLRAAQRKL